MTTGKGTLPHRLGGRAPSVPVVSYAPPVRPDVGTTDAQHRTAVRARLGLTDEDVLVASIGNFNPQKGHETLVRAMGRLGSSHVHCQIRGSLSPQHPDYHDRLLRLADKVGGPRLTMGPLDDGLPVPDLLSAADVFCLASEPRSEGLPTVILEAMSCGLPVVASDVGSVAEAVEDGVTGYLFPSRDAAALAGHLTKLAADDALRSRMGAAARRRAAADYTLERCLEANMRAITTARDAARTPVRPRYVDEAAMTTAEAVVPRPHDDASRLSVGIVHDYATQRGGAERVTLAMLGAFPGSTLHTTLYYAESTFPEFAEHPVRGSFLNRVAILRRHRQPRCRHSRSRWIGWTWGTSMSSCAAAAVGRTVCPPMSRRWSTATTRPVGSISPTST